MIPQIFPILFNNPTVMAILGTNPMRVFPFSEAPQNSVYPYVTWTVFSGDPQNVFHITPQVDILGTQVDIWGKTSASAFDTAVAVRDALEPHAHMVSIGSTERDPDTKSYRVRLDFDFFTER